MEKSTHWISAGEHFVRQCKERTCSLGESGSTPPDPDVLENKFQLWLSSHVTPSLHLANAEGADHLASLQNRTEPVSISKRLCTFYLSATFNLPS